MRPDRFSFDPFETSLIVQTSRLWMSALRLVDGHRHGEQTYCPTRHDSANQDHSQILSSTLKNCAYEIDSGGDHDGLSPTEAVHGEPTPSKCQYNLYVFWAAWPLHQRAKEGSAREGRIDSTYNRR